MLLSPMQWALIAVIPVIPAVAMAVSSRRARQRQQHQAQRVHLEHYQGFFRACRQLHDLDTWPADRTVLPGATEAPLLTITHALELVQFAGPEPVLAQANRAASAAGELAAVIDRARATTSRGLHGATAPSVQGELAQARRQLEVAADGFRAAARRDGPGPADIHRLRALAGHRSPELTLGAVRICQKLFEIPGSPP